LVRPNCAGTAIALRNEEVFDRVLLDATSHDSLDDCLDAHFSVSMVCSMM
jgi:hypothetical protein